MPARALTAAAPLPLGAAHFWGVGRRRDTASSSSLSSEAQLAALAPQPDRPAPQPRLAAGPRRRRLAAGPSTVGSQLSAGCEGGWRGGEGVEFTKQSTQTDCITHTCAGQLLLQHQPQGAPLRAPAPTSAWQLSVGSPLASVKREAAGAAASLPGLGQQPNRPPGRDTGASGQRWLPAQGGQRGALGQRRRWRWQ